MMKKLGFTLAEVLITLAIIGVVASMTLPALMTNTAEQQGVTGLKKAINTLTEAAQLSQAIDGFDYASLNSDSINDGGTQSLYALFSNHLNMDLSKSGEGKHSGYSDNYAAFLRDGSVVIYDPDESIGDDVGDVRPDGLANGFTVIVDTNGLKGPNVLSNCEGNVAVAAGGNDLDDDGGVAEAACNNKTQRVIRDQFTVRLRGGYAQPVGAAARWAMNR